MNIEYRNEDLQDFETLNVLDIFEPAFDATDLLMKVDEQLAINLENGFYHTVSPDLVCRRMVTKLIVHGRTKEEEK